MTESTTVPPVRVAVVVEAPIERAFAVFTEGFTTWWTESHHIGEAEYVEAVLEAREGGRWFERGVDGSECEWGRVLACDPPHRLVLTWQLTSEYRYDPDPERASEIEIRLRSDGPAATRVELEHRGFERHADGGSSVADSVSGEGGWPSLMERYAATARADRAPR